MRIEEIKERGYDKYDITVSWQPLGFLGRWLAIPRETTIYRGGGTVWHEIRTGDRPGTSTEFWLTNKVWAFKNRT